MLDDEDSSPLSENEIANIQSLLQKLEPKQVEEGVNEVEDGPCSSSTRKTKSGNLGRDDNDSPQDFIVDHISGGGDMEDSNNNSGKTHASGNGMGEDSFDGNTNN